MIRDIKIALENCDEKLAYNIAMRDDEIDNAYSQHFKACDEIIFQVQAWSRFIMVDSGL